MLAVNDLWAGYGPEPIIRGVSIRAEAGRVTALLGRNGAGKSTLLRGVAGLLTPRGGSIRLDGREIGGLPPAVLIRLGLSYVAQGRECFEELSVRENLEAALLAQSPPRAERRERVAAVLSMFEPLREQIHRPVSALGGGLRQILVVAMGLVQKPRCLVVDEPSLGMAVSITESLVVALRSLADAGGAVLIVEQKPSIIFAIGDHAYYLEDGRVALEGPPLRLKEDPGFIDRYLGLAAHAPEVLP